MIKPPIKASISIGKYEIERAALKKETDRSALERLKKIEKDLADLKEKTSGLKARWQKEKEAITKIGKITKSTRKRIVRNRSGREIKITTMGFDHFAPKRK